jgi:cysteine sulfinate desulfinase/cysteine desulfurase-like protein
MSARPAIYLDSNAGAPLSPLVKEAHLTFLTSGISSGAVAPNPTSLQAPGRQARSQLTRARDQVAASVGASDADQITFTS